MSGRSGLDVLGDMKRLRPQLPILILSMHPEDQYGKRVLQAGASGYLKKESAPGELIRAIRTVLEGGRYVSPFLADRLALLGQLWDLPRAKSNCTGGSVQSGCYTILCTIVGAAP
jgi:DNA-binding NarL/FixJ family response regulator